MTIRPDPLSRRLGAVVAGLVLLALGACGGGSPADVVPGTGAPAGGVSGPDRFLLFPNPQRQADGSEQINSLAYAQAYYAAIDPGNAKDTLAKWKLANGFGSGVGSEYSAVFGDARDLGYGRRITARRNLDGTIAFMVENYLVDSGGGYSYSGLNVDAAAVREPRWRVGINAIEFSPGPGGSVPFVKYFNFSPTTEERELMVDLDGRGGKAMPGICITCHGGRGDALTPAPGMPIVGNGESQAPGDVQGKANPLETDAFDFSSLSGFERITQEAAIKEINKLVLCTYPRSGPAITPEDNCRRPVASNYVWQGTNSAELIKLAYGGAGLPNPTYADTLLPSSWVAAGQTQLYQRVVVPYCRTCHLVRGVGAQSDIDFSTYEKFRDYANEIRRHVYDQGNMPLGKLVFERFWASNAPTVLADYLLTRGIDVRDAGGAIKRPGRPVAEPGPDRVLPSGSSPIGGGNSRFSTGYAWSMASGSATLANATNATPDFTPSGDGNYVLRLVVSRDGVDSEPALLNVVVKSSLSPLPSAIGFAQVKALLQSAGCTSCHVSTGGAAIPPFFFDDYDRNGDSLVNTGDDDWFYRELRGRINFNDLGASPLLRKPAGHHHAGGLQTNFNDALPPGDAGRANYDLILNWILAGAPQ